MFLFLIFTFCLVKARFVRDFLHLSLLPFPPSFQEKFQPAANAVWQPRGRRGGGRGKGFPSSLFLLCGSRGIGWIQEKKGPTLTSLIPTMSKFAKMIWQIANLFLIFFCETPCGRFRFFVPHPSFSCFERRRRRRCLNDPPLSPPLPHCLFSLQKKEQKRKRKRAEHTEFSHFRREREREIDAVPFRSVKERFFWKRQMGFSLEAVRFYFVFIFCSFPSFLEVSFFPIFFGRFFHRHFGNGSAVTSTHVRRYLPFPHLRIWENRSYTQPPFAQKLT